MNNGFLISLMFQLAFLMNVVLGESESMSHQINPTILS